MEFAQAAKNYGIEPITGAEITLSDDTHLTLLAETTRGYANLSRLLTKANLNSPRGEPRTDFAWLAEHAEGLIALSGCRKSEVGAFAEKGAVHKAMQAADRYRAVFGLNNYFIELQNNSVFEDEPRNHVLVEVARGLGVPLVATNNVHYHVRDRHRLHDVLIAVQHHASLEDARQHLRPNSEFFLKGPAEMTKVFADLPEAIANTERIAERCRFNLTRDLTYVFPDYTAEDGRDADTFLHDLCFKEARSFYGAPLPERVEIRLREELDLVREGQRAGFFLRLWEILLFIRENDLPARGRGSSVGSLVCFLLGLSGIDPMKYNLVVERFLNAERLHEDVPDIDIDFGRDARDRMFKHIFATYGTDHAAMVCNQIQYRWPMAVRDVGKALGLGTDQVDAIAKRMRSRFSLSLQHELTQLPGFESRAHFPVWRQFVELVEQLYGMPRHLAQHSGGVILSTSRMDEQVPVEATAMEGRFIGQWDKDSVADAGFIKLDLLGYPSLDQLRLGLAYVEERHGIVIDERRIDLTDQEVYAMMQKGDVIGVVQIQSRAQIQVLLQLRVTKIEDLIIQVALIRPGPIQGGAVHPYIARMLGHEPVQFDHPCLEPALRETKGVFIFQEQVIQAAMALAGFSAGQAEMLRKAMSRKRSREAMEALKNDFLAGAASRGVTAQVATTVYEKILAFSSFGFPKSHAAAMAETCFKVAWLKRYYPVEFYCALLNNQPMGFYSPEVIANDARRHGIAVLGVDVNKSEGDCSIEADDALRLGYRYMKGIGDALRERLNEEKKNGPYASLWQFWRRTRLQQSAIESLILAGAFAWTGLKERELLWQLGTFYQPLDDQLPLAIMDTTSLPVLRPMTHEEQIVADLELSGIAVRGSTMDLIVDQLHEGITNSLRLEHMKGGEKVTVAGLVAVRQAPETAKGFVFHTLEDYYGLINVITNPRVVPKFQRLIEGAPALIVHGRVERQERAVNVIAESFEALKISGSASGRVHSFG